jgi:hypothetical protein
MIGILSLSLPFQGSVVAFLFVAMLSHKCCYDIVVCTLHVTISLRYVNPDVLTTLSRLLDCIIAATSLRHGYITTSLFACHIRRNDIAYYKGACSPRALLSRLALFFLASISQPLPLQ